MDEIVLRKSFRITQLEDANIVEYRFVYTYLPSLMNSTCKMSHIRDVIVDTITSLLRS